MSTYDADVALVERNAELDRIRGLLAEARRGDGGALIAVSGEPGVGKSSLLREALAGQDSFWGWCEPGLTARPLGPFRDALAAGALGDISRSVDRGHLDEPEELLEAMRRRTLVVVVEDAHWIDDASARALRFLGRRIAETSGIVLVSHRDGIAPSHPLRTTFADLATAPGFARIELQPLSAGGVAEVLDGSGRDSEEAYRVTGGNPFLVSALKDAPGEELSASVGDLAWSWARRLEPGPLDLLRTLAVVPGRIALADLGERGAEADAIVAAGLLCLEDGHLRFRHELVRRALDQDLGPDERRRAHVEAYQRLRGRSGAEPSELAFHAVGAGMVEDGYRHDRDAAERAAAAGAHTQAVEHYRRAVEVAQTRAAAPELARLCIELAGEEYLVGHDADARRYAAKASALTDRVEDPLLYARGLMARSRVAVSEAECLEFAERALPVLEEIGGTELAGACADLATRRMVARDLEGAAEWARRALTLVAEDEHPHIAVNALQALGSALTLTGQDDACEHLRRAITVGERHSVDRELGLAHCNLISAAGEARLYDAVDLATPAALAFFEAHDLDALAVYTRAWLGRCAFEQGRWPEALRWIDDVLAGPAQENDIAVLTALSVRGRIRARRGDPGSAEALDQAITIASRTGALQRLAPAAVGRAEAAWLAAETCDPTDLRTALGLALERAVPAYVGELAFWLRRVGDDPGQVGDVPEPWDLLLAGDLAAAGQRWAALGCPYEAADAWSECPDETLLREALAIADQLGAAPLRARVVRALRELGVRSIPRGPRATTLEDQWGLTRREQEILGWLQRGSTDAEIAAGLHLSVKTVGHHVSAVLRKTGSSSRRELRTAAAR